MGLAAFVLLGRIAGRDGTVLQQQHEQIRQQQHQLLQIRRQQLEATETPPHEQLLSAASSDVGRGEVHTTPTIPLREVPSPTPSATHSATPSVPTAVTPSAHDPSGEGMARYAAAGMEVHPAALITYAKPGWLPAAPSAAHWRDEFMSASPMYAEYFLSTRERMEEREQEARDERAGMARRMERRLSGGGRSHRKSSGHRPRRPRRPRRWQQQLADHRRSDLLADHPRSDLLV